MSKLIIAASARNKKGIKVLTRALISYLACIFMFYFSNSDVMGQSNTTIDNGQGNTTVRAQDIANPPNIGVTPQPKTKVAIHKVKAAEFSWHQGYGTRFIFLRRPFIDDEPTHGQYYSSWSISNPGKHDASEFTKTISTFGSDETVLIYSKFVGKIVTCLGVDNQSGNGIFHVPDYDIDIRSSVYGGHVEGLAPIGELNKAKELWLGKTVYPVDYWLNTYNSSTQTSSGFFIDNDKRLKIVDAMWGDEDCAPVWLIVESNGKRIGYYALGVDRANKRPSTTSSEFHYDMILASSKFTTKTPASRAKQLRRERAKYHWSEEVWDAIDSQEVIIGMTSAQVRKSIGEPHSINEDIYADGVHQQWIYDNKFVYFEDGKCSAIQNRP